MKEILEIIPDQAQDENNELAVRAQRNPATRDVNTRPLKYKRGIMGEHRGIVSSLYRVNRQIKKAKRLKVV
jgi:hypothetical protein